MSIVQSMLAQNNYTLAKLYKQYCYQRYHYFFHISLFYKNGVPLKPPNVVAELRNVNIACDWLSHGRPPIPNQSLHVFGLGKNSAYPG